MLLWREFVRFFLILFRVLLVALFQYGLAGFGITIVSILRKEHFFSYGLKTEGMLFKKHKMSMT